MADKVSQETTKQFEHAYMLVGRFLSHWSHLESAVNDSVGSLLKMQTIEAAVATANMQLRSKLHIIKTMIDFRCGKTPWGKAALKDIERIGTLTDTWRNIVAHRPFGPHKDGVKFFVISARGKLTFPHVERSETDFLLVSTEVMELGDRVREITAALTAKKRSGGLFGMFANVPSSGPLGPDSPGLLGHLLLGSQDSPSATNGKDPQTPQEPEEKAE
jgi:hypothetical protein